MQQLTHEITKQRQQELRRDGNRPARQRADAPEELVIRLAAARDRAALERLAAFEGIELPGGSWLCAGADGAVTAALRLDDGTVLADPFARTSALRRVLEVYGAQLGGRRRRRWRPALSRRHSTRSRRA